MKQFFSCYLKSTTALVIYFFILLCAATKTNAQWIELGGANGTPFPNDNIGGNYIRTIATDAAGNVYANSVIKQNSLYYYFVAKWNDTAWSALGGVTFNGLINSIATDKSGNVYVGGGLTAANDSGFIAKWNGMAWSELGGTPFNGSTQSIATDISGNVYASVAANGKFYVAKWDGTAWTELGGTNGGDFNNAIISIATDASGNVYAAGDFTDANHHEYVAKWNGTEWSELGGLTDPIFTGSSPINSIATDAGGNVYAVGSFLDINADGYYVAKWNGTVWSELGGAPFGYYINSVATDAKGNVYAGGNFGDNTGNRFVNKWNGTTWSELGGAPFNFAINTIAVAASGNVYAGGNFTDSNSYYYVAEYAQGDTLILPAHPNTEIANYKSTDSNGWTNYYSGDTLLLSLNTHGQNIGTLGDGTFAVKLAATAGAGSNTSIQLTNPLITNPSGYWVMNRYWQVTTTTEPAASVGVRFYYNNQDLADVNGSYPNHDLTNQQLVFYKEIGGNPDPTTNLASATKIISILPSSYASDTTWTYHQLTDSTQYAEFSVSSFSGGGGGGTGNDQALPVKLLSFIATKQGTKNLLQWTTGQEINSNYFEVERSNNGVNYKAIGQVNGAGNSEVAKNYSLVDSKPVNGSNYYRLKIMDKDGKFIYSQIRSINETVSFAASIYPNPVQTNLNISITATKDEQAAMEVMDANGKVLLSQNINIAQGTSLQAVNVSNFAGGNYFITIKTDEGSRNIKFIKE